MNNRKKGFTLMELLIVIAIIGLLGTIITINLKDGPLTNTNIKICNESINEVEDAACVYVGLAKNSNIANSCRTNINGCNISLEVLVKEGLLDEETHNELKDKKYCPKETTISDTVNVKFSGGEKICYYMPLIPLKDADEE